MIYIFRGFLFGSLEEEDNRESRGYSWLLKLESWNLEHWRNKIYAMEEWLTPQWPHFLHCLTLE